ncbi:hypothetical protein H0H81_000586 [Sphagnurus paluster]|uniref:WD40 repeat-like protein n=1 Tax=Sphagnurus paluster TaxID=117069 RepID=A0A9P7FXU9_9AGAR|nr:hypothetical protein H0H81_000586 [Sphagnurus paluster]
MQAPFLADFADSIAPGATTPGNTRPSSSLSRRETILSLVEMLLQHNSDYGAGESLSIYISLRYSHKLQKKSSQSLRMTGTHHLPASVDEHLQVVGAEAFQKFEGQITNLDKELRNFANAARQLGSSVAILSSAFHLRERLAQLLVLYRQNAASLFPRKVTHAPRENAPEPDPKTKRRRRGRNPRVKGLPHVSRPKVNENLDPEFFPEQLEALAQDVATFVHCLNEFPEFTDEAVNVSIRSFERDLRYWASCLREYAGHFRYPSVQRYIHDLSVEMGEHIDSITSTLSMFIEVGVPIIRFAQKHGATNLLNLSTVATFFSAVTATTLQFSYELPHSATADSAGVTSTLTTVFTAFTSFGLAAVSTWFASERYIFLRHRGKIWLGDAITEYKTMILKLPGMQWLRRALRSIKSRIAHGCGVLRGLICNLFGITYAQSDLSDDTDDIEAGLPTSHADNVPPDINSNPYIRRRQSNLTIGSDSLRISLSPRSPPSTNFLPDSDEPPISHGKQLWQNALRSVRMRAAFSSPYGMTSLEPYRQRTNSSNTGTPVFPERKRTMAEEPLKALLRSRISALKPKLQQLEPTQDVAAHQALVRHLEFSPDGRYLATSSWDRTSMIFRVGDPLISHRILGHPKGFIGQIAWSPTGNMLLTKLPRAIKVWNAEDLNGNVLEQYDFGRMKLLDVAVTPDSVRLIGVGPLLESPTGLQPSKSRAEKRLVVYNMGTNQIENQTPVLNDVRDITLARSARSGIIALVSYENKTPPQLWKLDLVKDRDTPSIVTGRLTLRHTYMPKAQVDFAGRSYFGGRNNELVLCAGKGKSSRIPAISL